MSQIRGSFARVLKLGSGVSPSSRGAPPLVAGVCWIYYMLIFTCGIRRLVVTTRIILKSLPWLIKIFDFLFPSHPPYSCLILI